MCGKHPRPKESIRVCATPKGMVIAPFWSENGYRLCPFLVWNGVWFSWELWKFLNVFVVSIPDEKERKIICEFEVDFKKWFCWRFNLSNDDIISAYVGLKSGVENSIF